MNHLRNRAVVFAALVVALFAQTGAANAAAAWTLQSPVDVSGGTVLLGVACRNATTCVAVGQSAAGNGVVVERWNGTDWAVQSAPSPSGSADALHDVSCPTPSRCIAVGDRYGAPKSSPLAEMWNGTEWTVTAIPKPDYGQLRGVSCTSAHACTAVGGRRGLLLVLRWNGKAWKVQSAPLPESASGASFIDVSCTSATSCVAVGSETHADGTQSPLAETWDGNTWTVQPTPNPAGASQTMLLGVSCAPDAPMCVAVGQSYRASETHSVIERFDGSSWVLDNNPEPAGATFADLFGVACPSATTCEAVGYAQTTPDQFAPLAERWDGNSWTIQAAPSSPGITDVRPYAVSCSSPSACTLVGVSFDASNNRIPIAERYA